VNIGVIGAGVSGLSIAFQVLERGLGRVTVFDGAGIGAGASAVQPGGVRQQWGSVANCTMARESHRFYSELGDHLGVPVDASFEACGYLFVADRDDTLAQLETNVGIQRQAGVPSTLLTAEEAARLVPGLNVRDVAGASYCAEDGYFDRPQAVVAAFAEAARARGAQFEPSNVVAVERDRGAWRIATAAGTRFTADRIVIAAAAETARLVGQLGIVLPLASEPRFLFLGAPLRERMLDPLVIAVDRGLAAKQLADGRLLASDLRAAGDPATEADGWRANVRRELGRLLPRLAALPLPTLVEGTYDMTPDAQPVIDEVADGLWVAAGFSGHGFMVAPTTGRLVAAGLGGARLPDWAESVRLDRFVETNRDTQVI
jgi:sarcosine oxidase, subunit beta